MLSAEQTDRFWGHVDIGGPEKCWDWQMSLRKGYGNVSLKINGVQKKWGAHRIAWTLTHGKIPEGLCVCHHCDNPVCCNPKHLFLGTVQDNTDDKIRKGRQGPYGQLGELNAFSKLTTEQVRQIKFTRRDLTAGQLIKTVGLPCSENNVRDIRRGVTWAHIIPQILDGGWAATAR